MTATLLILAALVAAWLCIVTAAAIITGGNRQPETPINTTDDPSAVWSHQARDGQR